jgi:hypothetical protein
MLTILSVAIGLILVLLLMSILSSTVHDIIGLFLQLRGKHLQATLKDMLGSGMFANFKDHPFYKQLHGRAWLDKNTLPTWVKKETFRAILHDEVLKLDGNNLAEKIASVENKELREVLQFLVRESRDSVQSLKHNVDDWFEQVMERASDYYAGATKWRLFFIGLVLAGALNADTIGIYQRLSTNTELREKLVAAAEKIAAADTIPAIQRDSNLTKYIGNASQFMGTQINDLQSPLGLGWNEPLQGHDIMYWLFKILGIILTGIAVTFGASFWFELLKKILSVKNTITGGGNTSNTSFPASSRSMAMPSGPSDDAIGEISPEYLAQKSKK